MVSGERYLEALYALAVDDVVRLDCDVDESGVPMTRLGELAEWAAACALRMAGMWAKGMRLEASQVPSYVDCDYDRNYCRIWYDILVYVPGRSKPIAGGVAVVHAWYDEDSMTYRVDKVALEMEASEVAFLLDWLRKHAVAAAKA